MRKNLCRRVRIRIGKRRYLWGFTGKGANSVDEKLGKAVSSHSITVRDRDEDGFGVTR